MLLGIPDVQKELQITDEQKKQVDELLADFEEQRRSSFGSLSSQELQELSQEEREKRFAEARRKSEQTSKKADEKLGKTLDAEQLARLNQLRLQREGVGAFNRPEVARQLGLTEDQQEKVRKVQEAARPQGRGGPGGPGGFQNLSEEERRQFFARMQEQREKAQADILAVLTDGQKKKWSEMKGKEFKFPEPQGLGGFGPPGGGNTGERRRPEAKKKDN